MDIHSFFHTLDNQSLKCFLYSSTILAPKDPPTPAPNIAPPTAHLAPSSVEQSSTHPVQHPEQHPRKYPNTVPVVTPITQLTDSKCNQNDMITLDQSLLRKIKFNI